MTAKKMPLKGSGKKGGAVFPRYDLEAAIVAAKRLVSKSHINPVAQDVYYSGVLQVSGGRAHMKSSALKQFGFLVGNTKDGFSASPRAKQIANLEEGPERAAALRHAAVAPRVFRGLFDAFHGDTVTKGRLKQRAADLNVHPDMLDSCVKVYLDSLSFAGLVTVSGEQVTHAQNIDVASSTKETEELEGEAVQDEQQSTETEVAAEEQQDEQQGEQTQQKTRISRTGRALIQVNITLDSSLDTEKLAKQLELLKKFGAL